MENRKTVLISDLSEGKTSPRVIATDWQRIPYTCREFSGVMVMAHGTMSVPDICLDPKLTGWYRIYTGMLHTVGDEGADNLTGFALSSDRFPRYFEHYYQGNFDRAPLIAEAFWKAADMTGQSVRIIHPENGRPCLSNAAYLKFVPMSGEEVAEELADRPMHPAKSSSQPTICMRRFAKIRRQRRILLPKLPPLPKVMRRTLCLNTTSMQKIRRLPIGFSQAWTGMRHLPAQATGFSTHPEQVLLQGEKTHIPPWRSMLDPSA